MNVATHVETVMGPCDLGCMVWIAAYAMFYLAYVSARTDSFLAASFSFLFVIEILWCGHDAITLPTTNSFGGYELWYLFLRVMMLAKENQDCL
jgi:hypothetical protein